MCTQLSPLGAFSKGLFKTVIFCALLLVFFVVYSCTHTTTAKQRITIPRLENSVRVALNENFTTADPRKGRSGRTINLIKNIFEGLVRYDKENCLQYALASDIFVSPDGRVYTITLKPSYWSDGKKLTAYDFEYSWRSMLDPELRSPNAYQLFVIKNGKAVFEKRVPENALGIIVIDENTIEVTLETPISYFLDLLACPPFFPVPKHVCQNFKLVEEINPLQLPSNGPYVLKEWQPNTEFIIEKNPSYWDAKSVSIDQVIFSYLLDSTALQMFEHHELDFIGSPFSNIPLDAIETLKANNKLHACNGAGTKFLRLNTTTPFFANKKMRQAFNLACDRRGLTQHVLHNNFEPALSFVPPCLGLNQNAYFPLTDKAEAQRLFTEALPHTIPPPLSLMFAATEENMHIAQLLQQNFKTAFNCNILLENIEPKVFFDRLGKKQYDIALCQWYADIYDPINFLAIFESVNTGTNNTGWGNAAYAQLLDQANHTLKRNERITLLDEAQKILMDQAPIIPLYYFSFYFAKSKAINHIYVSPLNIIDFKDVTRSA